MSSTDSSRVSRLLDGLQALRLRYPPEPAPGSPAALERQAFRRPALIDTVYSYASIALQSATDHLRALGSLVAEADFSFAPWTCIRGTAEAAAWASWQLDPGIDATERVSRNFSIRYESLMGQRRMANGASDLEAVARIDSRIDQLESDALELGYIPVRDRRGRRAGIGQRKPSISNVLESEFDLQGLYRPLSSAAHSDSVALMQIGFAPVGGRDEGGVYAAPTVLVELQQLMLVYTAGLYVRPVWSHLLQFGRATQEAIDFLDGSFDELGLTSDARFRPWRTPAAPPIY
jgi:hypothetical protein